jgi:nitrogen fixation-related uncharacterized protein
MVEWSVSLVIIFLLGGLFFASAVYALYWAASHKQFQNFEKGAKTIFTEEEPLGVRTDFFPGKTEKGHIPPSSYRNPPSN